MWAVPRYARARRAAVQPVFHTLQRVQCIHTYVCMSARVHVCCHVSKHTHVRTCAGGTLTWKCRISTRRRRRNMSGAHGVLAVPNGAKPHGPAACSRVLRIGYSGTASTSSRRGSSASSRHGPSLAHIRAGTDRHWRSQRNREARRSEAERSWHACQPQMAAALSSPAPAQMWPG